MICEEGCYHLVVEASLSVRAWTRTHSSWQTFLSKNFFRTVSWQLIITYNHSLWIKAITGAVYFQASIIISWTFCDCNIWKHCSCFFTLSSTVLLHCLKPSAMKPSTAQTINYLCLTCKPLATRLSKGSLSALVSKQASSLYSRLHAVR